MYYFVSDTHFGLEAGTGSRNRERLFINWLEQVSVDAKGIFIVGDMFDFWYEYKRVVPKGFVRLLAKLAELTDKGIEVYFFPGNHDMWVYEYFQEECGVKVCHYPALMSLYGKNIYITHGDDVVARQSGLLTRLMNSLFRSTIVRWLFSHLVHPDVAMNFGLNWSSHSRKSKSIAHRFLAEAEPMVCFARQYLKNNNIDYFVFGHNHCAEKYPLSEVAYALFLGEWIESPTYATLREDGLIELHRFPAE